MCKIGKVLPSAYSCSHLTHLLSVRRLGYSCFDRGRTARVIPALGGIPRTAGDALYQHHAGTHGSCPPRELQPRREHAGERRRRHDCQVGSYIYLSPYPPFLFDEYSRCLWRGLHGVWLEFRVFSMVVFGQTPVFDLDPMSFFANRFTPKRMAGGAWSPALGTPRTRFTIRCLICALTPRAVLSGPTILRFWDVQTSLPRFTCRGHRHHVLSTAWSPNGKPCAFISRSCPACLWRKHRTKFIHRRRIVLPCDLCFFYGDTFVLPLASKGSVLHLQTEKARFGCGTPQKGSNRASPCLLTSSGSRRSRGSRCIETLLGNGSPARPKMPLSR